MKMEHWPVREGALTCSRHKPNKSADKHPDIMVIDSRIEGEKVITEYQCVYCGITRTLTMVAQ